MASRRRIDEVLAQADGTEVTVNGVPQTLELTDAAVTDVGMNAFQSLLHLLSDPNVAFVLFTIGLYGLLFELQNPNFVTGILGAMALLLAFIGFGSLPLNVAGLLLVGLGLVLFALETQVVSHGLLTVGGIICFALGASALYTEPGADPTVPLVQVATPLIVTTTATTAILMGFITLAAIRTRRMPAPAGSSAHPSRWAPRASSRRRWSRSGPSTSAARRGAPGPPTSGRSTARRLSG